MSVSDNDTVTLNDGTVVTVGDLKGGHLRQADYTRKTTELSEQRKGDAAKIQALQTTVDQFSAFRKSLEENPIEVIRGLQEHFDMLPETGNVDTPKDDVLTPQTPQAPSAPDNAILNEIKELQRQIATMKAETQVGASFEQVKAKYGDVSKDDLFGFAAKAGISDLEQAYKLMKFDDVVAKGQQNEENSTKRQIDALLAGFTSTANEGIPSGSATAGEMTQQYNNTEDAIRGAIAQIGLPS